METQASLVWRKQASVFLHCTQLAFRIYSLQLSVSPKPKRDGIVVVQSLVRRYLVLAKYRPIRAMDKKRANILHEILTTERKYNAQLHTIMELFYTPLVQLIRQPGVLVTEEDIKPIFNSIETVYSISCMLLKLLEAREGNDGWTHGKSVADIFLKVAPYMKALKSYFENYDDACAHIQRLKNSSPPFAKFIANAEKHPNCAKLDLPSLLITPIQRMPRYEMLLAVLAQNTPHDTPAWGEASKAATALQQVNKQINEGMRTNSTQKEMIVLQNLIDTQTKLGLPQKFAALLAPHRKLLRMGLVTMRSLRDASMQKRMLYLCNDLLITVTVFLNIAVKIDKVLPLISAEVIENKNDQEGVASLLQRDERVVLTA